MLVRRSTVLGSRLSNRHQVERFFHRIKPDRRVATRDEKTIEHFAGFVWLAALMVDVFADLHTP